MRRFDFPVAVDRTPVRVEPQEHQPIYQPSVYDEALFEADCNGNIQFGDITRILLHDTKYRKRFGENVINDILRELHPTKSTVQDSMTDEQRFESVISRHCQTVSERQYVLDQMLKSGQAMSDDLKSMIEAAKSAKESEPTPTAPAAPAASA